MARLRIRSATFLRFLIIAGMFIGASHVFGQIVVGSSGAGPISFTNQPTASEWSTRALPGGAADVTTATGFDTAVNTNVASTISQTLIPTNASLPSVNGLAMWSSIGFVQTRPTGDAFTLLKATLHNGSGSNLSAFTLSYDLTVVSSGTEELLGHRVYFSLSGAAGSWQNVPGLSGDGTSGRKSATLITSNWPADSDMYVLWADDNGSGAPDTALQLDNVTISGLQLASPIIAIQPQSLSAGPGVTVSLSVSVQGAPPFGFQWFKDGAQLTNATNATLFLTNVQTNDSGTYYVTVTNAFGSTTSSNAVLTVACTSAPVLTAQPVDQSIVHGGTISLSATATGTLQLAYQWYRNDTAIPGATNSTYTKTSATAADSGRYAVVVTNCGGTISSRNALVGVAEAPFSAVGMTNQIWQYDDFGDCPGSAWYGISYPAAGWRSGRGIFAFETTAGTVTALNGWGGVNTTLFLSNSDNTISTTTFYFRTAFVLTNEPRFWNFYVTNVIDDGAVFYLNGVEAFRFNMGTTTPSCTTFASGAATEGVFNVTNLRSSLFVVGTNVLAAEVHQSSANSSDVVFGLAIGAYGIPPVALTIVTNLFDTAIEEGRTARLAPAVSGQATSFTWYKNGVAIAGADRPELVLTNVTSQDTAAYQMVASNAVSVAYTRVAQLTVVIDTTPPRIVTADALDASRILVTFSEPLLGSTAEDIANYRVRDVFGAEVTIISASLSDGTNVLLTTSARSGTNYVLSVTNVSDASPRQVVIAANSAIPVASIATLVPYDATWLFFDPYPPFDDPNPGENWKMPGFAPSLSWGEGDGIFYAGTSSPPLPAPARTYLTPSSALESCFRQEFILDRSRSGLRVLLDLVVNDGAIVYLNGAELLRVNMPAGAADYLTMAATNVSAPITLKNIEIPASALVPGTNLLAAELHQAGAGDTEKVFGLLLHARAESLASGPIIVTGGPEDMVVVEGQTATFSVSQVGAEFFQWRVNGEALPEGTQGTLPLFATLSLDGARISVDLSNSTSTAVSTNATLRVIADVTPPTLLAGRLNMDGSIVMTFSEPISPASAAAPSHYLVTNGLGQLQVVTNAAVVNGTNVVLRFASLTMTRYTVVVTGLRDTSVAGNAVAPGSAVAVGFTNSIPFGGTWHYNDLGIDQGSIWRAPSFDDSNWKGPARGLFFASRVNVALPEPVQTVMVLSNADAGTQVITCYFRSSFSAFTVPTATLNIATLVDDGCIVYLNGTEIFRLGMPAGSVNYGTLASRTVDFPAFEGPFAVTVTNLVDGANVIAVEVHQRSTTTAHAGWDGAFSLAIPSVPIAAPVCAAVGWSAPQLRSERIGNVVNLSWVNPMTNAAPCSAPAAFILQRSALLGTGADWQYVTNVSPATVTSTNSAQFFRLRLQP